MGSTGDDDEGPGARHLPGGGVHDAAGRQHRQRRAARPCRSDRHAAPAACSGSSAATRWRSGCCWCPAGRLGDARSRRPVFVVGLAVFTPASAARRRRPEQSWLVVARLVQGIAGGMVNPQIAGLIQTLFRGRERGRAFGLLGRHDRHRDRGRAAARRGADPRSPGRSDGWRWVFYVNVPVGARRLPARPGACCPHPDAGRRRESLDPVGVLLLGLGVGPSCCSRSCRSSMARVRRRGCPRPPLTCSRGFVRLGALAHRAGAARWTSSCSGSRSYALGATSAPLLRRVHRDLLHPHAVPAERPALHARCRRAWRSRRSRSGRRSRDGRRPAWSPGSAVRSSWPGWLDRHRRAVRTSLCACPRARHVGRCAAPLLVAGLGSGLVISPNQTLTLAEVPVERAGSAAGVCRPPSASAPRSASRRSARCSSPVSPSPRATGRRRSRWR